MGQDCPGLSRTVTMSGGFYSNFFLFLFLLLLLIFFLRLLYARHMLWTAVEVRSPSNSPSMAPYFIRLRAVQDARLYQQREQAHRQATDFPPQYDDIIYPPSMEHVSNTKIPDPQSGCWNPNLLDDTGLPAYQYIVEQVGGGRWEAATPQKT